MVSIKYSLDWLCNGGLTVVSGRWCLNQLKVFTSPFQQPMGIWLSSVPERWGIWKESSSLSIRIHVFYLLIWRSFKVNSSLSWAIDAEKKVYAKVLVIVWKVAVCDFAFYMKNWLLTHFTLTSVCIFSILFYIHFLRFWKGEFV